MTAGGEVDFDRAIFLFDRGYARSVVERYKEERERERESRC